MRNTKIIIQYGAFQLALLVFYLLNPYPILSQEIIHYSDSSDILNIGKKVYFLEDTEGTLNFKDILKHSTNKDFVQSKEDVPNFGNTRSVIWCRFSLTNTSMRRCYLEIDKSIIQKITLFTPLPDGKGYTSLATGTLLPFNTRQLKDNYFIFGLLSPKSEIPHTFYLRIESKEAIELPMQLGTLEKIFPEHASGEMVAGIYIGFMTVMLLYNFFIFFKLRDSVYLLYAAFLFCMLMLNDMMFIGKGFQYIWPAHPWINFQANTLTALLCISMILFTRVFLQTKKYSPLLNKGLYLFTGINVIIIILNIGGDYFISSIACQLVTFLLAIYLIVTGVVIYRNGLNFAKYYLLAFINLLIGAMFYILYMNNLIEYSLVVKNAPLIGSTIEVLLLSFAMGENIDRLRKEKARAQREKLEIIETQNATLERLVQERTDEIGAQSEEIASQYEELLSQQDHIRLQNKELEKKNSELSAVHKVIEKKNEELEAYSSNLEEEIDKRTADLSHTNQELIDQNHQLEQFAFITAHNLRSPVARLQGLCNILSFTREDEKEFILAQILNSSKELDRVISDLTKILEVKKGMSQNFEWVNLDGIMEKVKSILAHEILKNEVIIYCDFKNGKEIYGMSAYIESIFYNLTSNAIKYKSLDRVPTLNISSERIDDTIKIKFSDNGIGIDLAKYKDKVFGIYKRFHDHVEGKGLGLHLVKTQVEAMKGKIEIYSTVNKGTTFEITMPIKKTD